jgi:hypothetical protein
MRPNDARIALVTISLGKDGCRRTLRYGFGAGISYTACTGQ